MYLISRYGVNEGTRDLFFGRRNAEEVTVRHRVYKSARELEFIFLGPPMMRSVHEKFHSPASSVR